VPKCVFGPNGGATHTNTSPSKPLARFMGEEQEKKKTRREGIAGREGMRGQEGRQESLATLR